MRENRELEFKREITNTFLKTVSAFANFQGGMILFGVDDHGEKVGLADPEGCCMDIENRINDAILPKPDFELSVEGNIIKLKVHKGKYTPYLYRGKAYRRSNTATIEVDQGELRELILEAENRSFEELPCNETELTFVYLEAIMKEQLSIGKISMDILRTIGFVSGESKFNHAAAVTADCNSFYGIDIAKFGDSINEIMDRETVSGRSVLLQYDKAVELYKRYYQYEKIEGVQRETVELIPERAFREALANALVHRDWSAPCHVRVSMHKDKIVINSPGGLPRGISEAEYLNGEISCLRNPIIGNLFFRLHYIEMFGTGIKRICASYEQSVLKPEFKITENVISVMLPVMEAMRYLSEEEKRILEILNHRKIASSSELAALTGYSKAKVIRIVNPLLEKGYLKQRGKGRSTKYTLE